MDNPSYSGTVAYFTYQDDDGDPLTGCQASCANGCCTIMSCRSDLFPLRVYYKDGTTQPNGSPCSMTITLTNKWASSSRSCTQQFTK